MFFGTFPLPLIYRALPREPTNSRAGTTPPCPIGNFLQISIYPFTHLTETLLIILWRLYEESLHSLRSLGSEGMATTVGSFQVASAAFCGALSSSKSRILSGRGASNAIPFGATNGTKFTMSAEWMPGQPRPAYLDGSAPGDFGFDPFRLGRKPELLERFKESEVFHCRLAMVAVPGMLIPEALGLGNWVKAQEWAAIPGGQATYLGVPVPWGNLPTILAIEFLAVAFVEYQRIKETDIEKKKYPGGPFDPLGLSKDLVQFEENKVKEIKNGRLALVAFVGICVQAISYPGTGPLENLATHLADPWHRNIADVVIPRSLLPY